MDNFFRLSSNHVFLSLSSSSCSCAGAAAGADADMASPDVVVIEDELNLEELMKQKELLQARLGAYMSDTDHEATATPMGIPARHDWGRNGDRKGESNKNDVILLDDSSGERITKRVSSNQSHRQPDQSAKLPAQYQQNAMPSRKPARRSASAERRNSRSNRDRANSGERSTAVGRQAQPQQQASDRNRRDYDNRKKEDLRRELDRDKERMYRERERIKRHEAQERQRRQGRGDERDYRGGGGVRGRGDDRMRDGRGPGDYRMNRDNNYRDNRNRDRSGGAMTRASDKDKYKDSFSDGQTLRHRRNNSSSDSEIGDIDINDDEEDEEKIIEMRRKQREELIKVWLSVFLDALGDASLISLSSLLRNNCNLIHTTLHPSSRV